MSINKTILLIVFAFSLFSCNRLKRKGQNLVDKTKETLVHSKQQILEKKDQLIDKVFPIYDSDIPDTDNNQKRFKEHLQVELTSEVKNIYTFGDFLGADFKVLISFSCDSTTINAIVKAKAMTISNLEKDEGLLFQENFPWWNKEKIATIKPYKIGKENEYWQYLWYDTKSKTAYYESFSL